MAANHLAGIRNTTVIHFRSSPPHLLLFARIYRQHETLTLPIDPRAWVREGEKSMKARVIQAFDDFRTAGAL
jgi:hypothetical protein